MVLGHAGGIETRALLSSTGAAGPCAECVGDGGIDTDPGIADTLALPPMEYATMGCGAAVAAGVLTEGPGETGGVFVIRSGAPWGPRFRRYLMDVPMCLICGGPPEATCARPTGCIAVTAGSWKRNELPRLSGMRSDAEAP
mmetsp:Transcript_73603/g.207889  ORF Transcript_73603/g.207889 Transcript_73603/m.207889 type:complete len:141 (-) Transcript_73603:2348-2770(-)